MNITTNIDLEKIDSNNNIQKIKLDTPTFMTIEDIQKKIDLNSAGHNQNITSTVDLEKPQYREQPTKTTVDGIEAKTNVSKIELDSPKNTKQIQDIKGDFIASKRVEPNMVSLEGVIPTIKINTENSINETSRIDIVEKDVQGSDLEAPNAKVGDEAQASDLEAPNAKLGDEAQATDLEAPNAKLGDEAQGSDLEAPSIKSGEDVQGSDLEAPDVKPGDEAQDTELKAPAVKTGDDVSPKNIFKRII